MDLSQTPIANRIHISFFGCTNAGKSSVANAVLNQQMSVVSDVKGTTTDPVKKTMELLPLGAVVIYDTAGIDDETELSKLRTEKTFEILNKTDIAILVADSTKGLCDKDIKLIEKFKDKKIPYIVAYNKSDLIVDFQKLNENEIYISAKCNKNIEELKEKIIKISKSTKNSKLIIADKLKKNDVIILVTPIDESAPKGRLILPQQMTLRELLDFHHTVIVCQDDELEQTITNLKQKPKLIITDSQVFNKVKSIIPNDIFLTSFSILFARYKGNLDTLINGVKKIEKLKNGDKILISEGCTHHRQCNDIGSVKIPKLIEKYTNKKFDFSFTQGGEFPSDLSEYSLVVHCGACMLNEAEMKNRIQKTVNQNINIVNYGILLAHLNGILNKSIEIFSK